MFFLPRGSTSFCQKTAPLPCSLFNDQITIPSFPPSWTASAKTPTASGGNILSIGYFLMKVRCHSLKKQLIIFASSPPRCCKQDCCKSPICQPLRGQAAATTSWKSGSWGKERCGLVVLHTCWSPVGALGQTYSTGCSHGRQDELWRQHLLI